MTMNISSLPSPTAPIPSTTDEENPTPETPTMSFSELWSQLWADKKDVSFLDIIDIINPLQHIPVRPQLRPQLAPVHIGQSDVEDQQVEMVVLGQRQGLGAGLHRDRGELLVQQQLLRQ